LPGLVSSWRSSVGGAPEVSCVAPEVFVRFIPSVPPRLPARPGPSTGGSSVAEGPPEPHEGGTSRNPPGRRRSPGRSWPRLVLLTVAALLAGLLLPAGAATVDVRVGVSPVMSSSGLFLALDKGYFKAEGLRVRLIPFRSSGPEMLPPPGHRPARGRGWEPGGQLLQCPGSGHPAQSRGRQGQQLAGMRLPQPGRQAGA